MPAFAKVFEIVRPHLHHSDAFSPKVRSMHVGAADVVSFLVRQLPFDRVLVPTPHFVQSRRGRRSKAVHRYLIGAVSQAPKSGIQRVLA